jgi:integrase
MSGGSTSSWTGSEQLRYLFLRNISREPAAIVRVRSSCKRYRFPRRVAHEKFLPGDTNALPPVFFIDLRDVRLQPSTVSVELLALLHCGSELMYATGARVSEVVRLRWRDFDFDRRVVQGKGRVDRQVMPPRVLSRSFTRFSSRISNGAVVP